MTLIAYIFLAAAIFFTFTMISYLIHLNDMDLPLPRAAQILDVIVIVLLSAFWSFVIYFLKHPDLF